MDWIQTYTGRRFFPLAPKAEDVELLDIAHALSLKTRFGGHGRVFYSVAEHCVRVSRAVAPEHALWGLMHDAAEAYLADVPRPVKAQWPAFGALEDQLLQIVAQRFALPWPVPEQVWKADDVLLATEVRDLMVGGGQGWSLCEQPLEQGILPLDWKQAEGEFLHRFEELKGRSSP